MRFNFCIIFHLQSIKNMYLRSFQTEILYYSRSHFQ